MYHARVLHSGIALPRLLQSTLLAPRQPRHSFRRMQSLVARPLHLAFPLSPLRAVFAGCDLRWTAVINLAAHSSRYHRRATMLARVRQYCAKTAPHPSAPLPYKERQAIVTTCGELYQKWRAEGRHGYSRAPETGAQVPVVYLHTRTDRAERGDRHERPLALLLTGAPGQYSDYNRTISHLDQNGADVLCFNWPNFTFSSQTGYWWHSSDEKTNLMVDFLKQLGIKKVDMLVAHSTASPPAVQLAAQRPDIEVKSLALFMPITSRVFKGGKNPLLFNPILGWVLKARGGEVIAKYFMQSVMALSRHPTRGRAYDVFFAYLSAIGYEQAEIDQHLATLRQRTLPTLIMVSNNDRLLSVEDNHRLVRKMGCDPRNAWLYDEQGQLVKKGNAGVVKVIELEKGSHYGFNRFPDIANDALMELLNSVSR